MAFQDEVIALQDKVIIRASDLMTWMVEDGDWDWGFVTPSCEVDHTDNDALSKAFMSDRINKEDKLVQFFHQPRKHKRLSELSTIQNAKKKSYLAYPFFSTNIISHKHFHMLLKMAKFVRIKAHIETLFVCVGASE